MNVLVISHLWPRADFPHLGVFVADQVAELANLCSVCVLAPVDLTHRSEEVGLRELLAGRPQYRARSQPDFISVNGIKPRPHAFRAAPFRQALALITARNLAQALEDIDLAGVDLVHAHTLFPDGLACALWLKNKPIPLIVTGHGSDVHSMPAGVKKALPQLLDRADRFIVVSRALADRMTELGANPEKISVVPNGFPADLFETGSWAARDSKKIVFLGRLGAVKRLDLLIRAMPHLPAEIQLDIAGDGAERARLESLVHFLKLGHRVRFRGAISRQQVSLYLAEASLMCLVSKMEGWPTVIFESLACGTPVLATAVGGTPEALADPRLGILIPPDISSEKLAAQIQSALERSWDHDAIRQHALNYTWRALSRKIFDLYLDLSASKKSTLKTKFV